MRELVLKEYGASLRTRRGLLVVSRAGGEKVELSPSELDLVVIASGGVSVTARAVRLLMRHGVDLVFLDERGQPVGRVYPPFINKTVLTRRKQYEAYFTAARWSVVYAIVEAKIRNQANLLKYYAKALEAPVLREAAEEVLRALHDLPRALGDAGAVVSVEAKAARAYWGGVALLLPRELGFEGRDHDSLDPVNLCLNYCYALLYSRCWRALVLAGLDPYAGFLHADRSGKESLVYDFSEMFKPSAVDRMLISAFREGWRPRVESGLISRDSRAELVSRFSQWMKRRVRPTSGEPCTLDQALKRWAVGLASYLRGEAGDFKGFVEPW